MRAVKENTRALLRVVKVNKVVKHHNADKLDIAFIDGWQCVVARDSIKEGQLAFYAEIDSLLPIANPMFSFLESIKDSIKIIDGVAYSRIRTLKKREELSQGLLIPIVEKKEQLLRQEGDNVTEEFGVLKYVSADDFQYEEETRNRGRWYRFCEFIRGNKKPSIFLGWPNFLTKSEQERAQNIPVSIQKAIEDKEQFELSYKLNGMSVTAFCLPSDDNNTPTFVGVCSRNNRLRTENVNYTLIQSIRHYVSDFLVKVPRMIKKREWLPTKWERYLDVNKDVVVKFFNEDSFLDQDLALYCGMNLKGIAIQGELCGPGIQANYEQLKDVTLFIYTAYSIDYNRPAIELSVEETKELVKFFSEDKVRYIPVLEESTTLPENLPALLKLAVGKSFNGKAKNGREGIVAKSLSRTNMQFKVISNKYLMKEKD